MQQKNSSLKCQCLVIYKYEAMCLYLTLHTGFLIIIVLREYCYAQYNDNCLLAAS